jgi:hypothetical protein
MLEKQELIKRYILPESDTVKIVFQDSIEKDIENWEEEISNLIDKTMNGDKKAFQDLIELVYLNAYNEGEISYASIEKGN